MTEVTKQIKFLPPPDGVIGGHASGYDDPKDISESIGKYKFLFNCHPDREGMGWFTKRRAHQYGLSLPTTPIDFSSDRIARQIIQRGKTIQISGVDVVRDIIWVLFCDEAAGANQYEFGIEKYTPDEFYDIANWSGAWELCTESTTFNGTNFNVYPCAIEGGNTLTFGYSGLGIWLVSKRGHVSMPMGSFGRTAANVKYAQPLKGVFINRDPAAPYFNGLFADPQSGTAGDHAGTVTVKKAAIVPERPLFFPTGIDLKVHAVLPYKSSLQVLDEDFYNDLEAEDTRKVFRSTGRCYPGRFIFKLYPRDELGDIGAPILIKEAHLPIYHGNEQIMLAIATGAPDPKYGKPHGGVSIWFQLTGITDDITSSNFLPHLKDFVLSGQYKPEDPNDSIWTASPHDGGMNLAIPPEEIPEAYITAFDLNGRQYDPVDSTAWTATRWEAVSTSHNGWMHSARFNNILLKKGFIARAKRTNTNNLEIPSEYVFDWQFGFSLFDMLSDLSVCSTRGGTGFTTDDHVRIEIVDKFGVTYVDSWKYDKSAKKVILTTANNLPGSNGDYFDVRFCNTWEDDTGTRSIRFQTCDPSTWDQSFNFPFPEDAKQGFSLWYPNYTGQCESELGNERLIWDFYVGGVRYQNKLRTNDESWSRFPIEIEVPGLITGAAFLSETAFIVTTADKAWLGRKWIDEEGYKHIELTEQLKYGHRGYQIKVHDRIAYGFSPKFGLWMITVDSSRIRADISPYGRQVLLMPKGLQNEVRLLVGAKNSEEIDNINMALDQESIMISLPTLTGAAAGGGKNNISMRSPAGNGSFWLSFYDETKMWSFDFVVGASDAIESTASDGASTNYVRIAATGHGLSAGDYIVAYQTANINGLHKVSNVSDADHFDIPVTFIASDTGFFRLAGTVPLFRLNDGVSGNLCGDTQTKITVKDDSQLKDTAPFEVDIALRVVGLLGSTPEFRSPSYPGKDVIENAVIDLEQQGLIAMSPGINVVPYHDRVRKQGVKKTAITASGPLRGINSLGNTFRFEFEDFSTGTPRIEQVDLNINSWGRNQ